MKIKNLYLLFLSLGITSCATFSGSHPSKVDNAKKALEKNIPASVENKFLHTFADDGVNASLGFLETGRFEQLVGNVDTSLEKYTKATEYVSKSQAEAKIRVRNIVKNVQANLSSDKERYYYISDYEITFLYIYQALNYLKMNDLENAAVSIRNLSYAQYATFQAKDLAEASQNVDPSKMSHVKSGDISSKLNSTKEFRQLSAIANKIKNSYENAFGYYLAAFIYEAYDTDLNNTNLSMQNALSVVPNNPYVQKDAKQINDAFYGKSSLYEGNQGKLVVLYENGWVEPIQRFDLPITIFFQVAGVQKISLPFYGNYNLNHSSTNVEVLKSGKTVAKGNTELLVDTTAMAAKSLSDQYTTIVTREVLRMITKTAISVAAIKNSGDYAPLAAIGTSIYNLVTTQADQRSWNLLPKSVGLFSTNLDEGIYTVRINGKLKTISIKPQTTTLLWNLREGGYENIVYNGALK
ncbi:hypothetical protein QIW49_08595 [Francisellaceae bacterium CB300]|jgi:hypothetical protein